jgi:hypothetical protein
MSANSPPPRPSPIKGEGVPSRAKALPLDGGGLGGGARAVVTLLVGVVLAATLVSTALAGGSEWEGKKLLNLPTNFIVGYGSLINSGSRNSTATAPIAAIPVRVKAAFGYIRTWNERSRLNHWTALGLRKPRPGERAETINGVLYPVDAADLGKFDKRESGYQRVEVLPSQIETVGWQPLPAAGHFWIYVPRAVARGTAATFLAPDADYPVVESYVDIVVEGGLEYSPEFAREIIETTDGWSRFWLNDREVAHRPWVHDPRAMDVDKLLAGVPATAALLPQRAFEENWGEVARHGGK